MGHLSAPSAPQAHPTGGEASNERVDVMSES